MSISSGTSTLFVITLLLIAGCADQQTKVGLDRVSEYSDLFCGKRIGIITNHTGYNSEGKHIVDVFAQMEGVTVTALFGPEHGIRGKKEAGAKVDSEHDLTRQLPIYSLYGKTRKPTAEMLESVDILVFDIQDIGARFYTYVYTMALAMEAAAEHGKQFIVLDRPNPITGALVEGNILESGFATFVGLYPIPVRHGMTVAELARMFNEEGWLGNGVCSELCVIPVSGWHRKQWYDETGLRFVAPSPNMPNIETATVYPGTCLLEGTNISEGRGTDTPFRVFGAPWIEGDALAAHLNQLNLPGVTFTSRSFTPKTISGKAVNPKYEARECFGAQLHVTNRLTFEPYWTGIRIVNSIFRLYPDSLRWHVRHFDRLCGTDKVRLAIEGRADLDALRASWQRGLTDFRVIRKKYLMYD